MVPLLERLKRGQVLTARNRPESPGLCRWEKRALSAGTMVSAPAPVWGLLSVLAGRPSPCCLCVTLGVPVLCETPQGAADMLRGTGYVKMKHGYTKLLDLWLEKSIRPKIVLWPLQSDSELVSHMACICKPAQVKCWKEMVDYCCDPFVMSISLGPTENLQA